MAEEKNGTQKSRGRKLAEKQVAKVYDYKKTFGSEQGKRILADLFSSHYVMNSTYTRSDALEMAFREGQRQVVLRILTILNMDPINMKRQIEESHDYVQND